MTPQHAISQCVVNADHVGHCATTQPALSNGYHVCSFVNKLMAEAGLTIREDPMGNIWGRWAGSDAEAGAMRF